ncbi:hypothetical protein CEXT_703341 [Caerostris extrusa]|uniref:Uncharacterized protein n=1 Tax=Caerostris extrusa TaxID=172846 RepID=A0AAV4SAJ1_CAEEX|nr:hypothetical protein CEXT_703341 [Caerostris extrusa]
MSQPLMMTILSISNGNCLCLKLTENTFLSSTEMAAALICRLLLLEQGHLWNQPTQEQFPNDKNLMNMNSKKKKVVRACSVFEAAMTDAALRKN